MNIQTNKFPHHIFRAYDIRGQVTLLNEVLVHAIACAFVERFQQLQQSTVVLGYDARLTSPLYSKIIKSVLQPHFNLIELGCCSTPQMYYAALQHQGSGIMITASHNPKSDNGIKWMVQGRPPSPQDIQHLAQIAEGYMHTLPMPYSHLDTQKDADQCLHAYIQQILSDIHLQRSFKVVVDGLNGSAGATAVQVLERLGCQVIAMRCEANGEFPLHAPDPSKAKHLQALQRKVSEHQAALGIALDGDGDRVVLVDDRGHIIRADRLLALLAKICLKQCPQAEVVYDVKCSSLVRQTIERCAGKATMIRTGSSFLRQYLAQSKGRAVLGGEYAGHYVFNDGRGLGYDDGLYAALRILEYLSQTEALCLSQLMTQFPERCSTEDNYIHTHHLNPTELLAQIAIAAEQVADAELSQIDGIRLDFEQGFGIIRASNTGEYFTVRFDADTPAELTRIRQVFASLFSDHYPMIAQDILNAQ